MNMLRKFTFWLAAASVAICLNNALGNDDANILLFGLNPLLHSIVYTEPLRHWIFDYSNVRFPANSASVGVRFSAYVLHFISFILIGLIADLFIKKATARRREV